ncbi:MAG: NADH-quinone oxidoreductase subunit N [Nitrospirae bacterium]|nr:MAG: NADH-quinone oxidoreductase subunit N [Nitrospirota bacterium]
MTFDLNLTLGDLLLMLPELWVTLWICVVLCVDFLMPRLSQRTIGGLSVAGMGVALVFLLWYYAAGTSGILFKGMFVLDRLALFFKILVIGTSLLVLLSSFDYVGRFSFFKSEYYFLVMMAALGMMFMSSANDLLSVFVTVEFSTFGFYVLVAYLRDDLRSSEAGLKFFILGVFAAALLAYGTSLVYGETGTFIFPTIAGETRDMTPGLVVGWLMIFAALGFKIGAVPLHSWIPDTYQGAPTPITAFLSIAPKGAAFAILLRMFFSTLAAFKPQWVWLMIGMAMLSMLYGNIVAIAQRNIKRLLAYSGIAQIGNILIGMAAGTRMGADSVLFYLLTYLFANLGAFAVVIAFSQSTNSDEIEDYSGLNRRSPFLAFTMLVFLLSLAGVPPLAGFIGKLYLFVAAIKEGLYTLIVVGLISIVISLYYYLVVVKKMYISEPSDPTPITVSGALQAVIYVGLAGTLILGVYPKPFIEYAVAATTIFSHLGAAPVVTTLP